MNPDDDIRNGLAALAQTMPDRRDRVASVQRKVRERRRRRQVARGAAVSATAVVTIAAVAIARVDDSPRVARPADSSVGVPETTAAPAEASTTTPPTTMVASGPPCSSITSAPPGTDPAKVDQGNVDQNWKGLARVVGTPTTNSVTLRIDMANEGLPSQIDAVITPNTDLADGKSKLSISDFHDGTQVTFAVHRNAAGAYELLVLTTVPPPQPPSPADSAAIAAKEAAAAKPVQNQTELPAIGDHFKGAGRLVQLGAGNVLTIAITDGSAAVSHTLVLAPGPKTGYRSHEVLCTPSFTVGQTILFAATRTGVDTYELDLVQLP